MIRYKFAEVVEHFVC